MASTTESAILLISAPDQQGLVAAVTRFLAENEGNILDLRQHVDTHKNIFFMRVEWDLADFKIPNHKIADAFAQIADPLTLSFSLHFSTEVQRMAIFVSKQSHCLYDLLARWQSGEFNVEIPLIISNHPTLRPVAQKFGIPFYVLSMNAENKPQREQEQLELLQQYQADFIVLARYMQILSEDFVANYPNRIINIHHSFLPAFIGAKPYHQAYERGVKIIGATSHYVTADLDGGPIIRQAVVDVNHEDSVGDMMRKGRDLEKTVLAGAVWQHLQHRILPYGNRTIVFG